MLKYASSSHLCFKHPKSLAVASLWFSEWKHVCSNFCYQLLVRCWWMLNNYLLFLLFSCAFFVSLENECLACSCPSNALDYGFFKGLFFFLQLWSWEQFLYFWAFAALAQDTAYGLHIHRLSDSCDFESANAFRGSRIIRLYRCWESSR